MRPPRLMRYRRWPARVAPLLLLLGLPAAVPTPEAIADGQTWLVVPPQSLEVDPGSPLDFSALSVGPAVGSRGPVVPRGDRLVFADGSPARFNCAMMNTAPLARPEFPTHDESDALAVQLRRHGYTMVRQQFVDFRLTRGAASDLDLNAEQLDRYFYFLAALKKNGIAWALDVVSAQGKGVRGEAWGAMSPDDLRVRIMIDPTARALWLKLVDVVFARTNPYTGTTTLADPALAFVVGANENSFAFSANASQPFPTGFGAMFDRWLRARFPAPDALAAALPDLSPAERAGAPIALPSGWRGSGERSALLLRFASEREVATHRWMTRMLADRGFHGPVLGADDANSALTSETRSALPVVDVHAYGGSVASRQGQSLGLPSATVDEGLGNWLPNLTARWWGQPATATEYDQPFPGRFRYESGLLFPALARFQGFDFLCRAANMGVDLAIPDPGPGVRPLRASATAIDPNLRAQETLATMLFFRGDVAPATRIVALPFGDAQFGEAGSAFLPSSISRAALLAGFRLVRPERAAMLPRGVVVLPPPPPRAGLAARAADRAVGDVFGSSQERLAATIARLRQSGVLPPGNRTDPAAGLYQSASGEITLDQRANRIAVVTPRTEAVSTVAPARDLTLGALRIADLDAPALVGATSLDGAPLSRSRRVLLVMTGDVRNTAMQLTDLGHEHVLFSDWGRLPMLMRRVRASLTLRHDVGGPARLTVLSLRGAPLATRTLTSGQVLDLDNAAVPGMPTTFFLVEYPR